MFTQRARVVGNDIFREENKQIFSVLFRIFSLSLFVFGISPSACVVSPRCQHCTIFAFDVFYRKNIRVLFCVRSVFNCDGEDENAWKDR